MVRVAGEDDPRLQRDLVAGELIGVPGAVEVLVGAAHDEAHLAQLLDRREDPLAEDRVEWSPNIERIFGLAPGSFAGTYEAWLALIHPDDRGWLSRTVGEAVSRNEPYDVEFRFGEGGGGWGPSDSMGWVANPPAGTAAGFGVDFTLPVDGVQPPTQAEFTRPVDPGDGTVFRFIQPSAGVV